MRVLDLLGNTKSILPLLRRLFPWSVCPPWQHLVKLKRAPPPPKKRERELQVLTQQTWTSFIFLKFTIVISLSRNLKAVAEQAHQIWLVIALPRSWLSNITSGLEICAGGNIDTMEIGNWYSTGLCVCFPQKPIFLNRRFIAKGISGGLY